MSTLTAVARSVLLHLPEVTRMGTLRRCSTLYTQAQGADSLYLIEEGLVKLTRNAGRNGHIILSVLGPGHLVGEECMEGEGATYYADAEVLTAATVHRVPRTLLAQHLPAHPELAEAVLAAISSQKRVFAQKIELLCLHDVEYRILHYLAELAAMIKPSPTEGYQLPITQLELADLVGATRETTSTTLNHLERRGLIRLSRRLMTIPSPGTLRAAAAARAGSNGSH